MNNIILDIGKAHQRKIREEKEKEDSRDLFSHPVIVDIKQSICKKITYEQAKLIILEYEWLGTMGTTQIHYGIFFDDFLAGAICFGYFQAMQGYSTYIGDKYVKNGIQLSRGACAHWAHQHSASKLIGYGLNQMSLLGYKYVIAFSDPNAGEIGTVYQATNWHYLGFTNHSPHYDLYYKNGLLFMNDRDFFKKYKFCGKKQMQQFAEENNLQLKERLNKARYIKLIGNKRENKEMMKVLQSKILPYPKRKT